MLASTTRVSGQYTINTMPFQERNGKYSARFFAIRNDKHKYPIPITIKIPSEFEYTSPTSFDTLEEAMAWIGAFADDWVAKIEAQVAENVDTEEH